MNAMQIEAGKFYRTRDGRKVGPMNVPPKMKGWASVVVADTHDGINSLGFCGWCDGGRYFPNRDSVDDLIAEWTDDLPHGHARLPSGAVVDLTAITTPFGLLDAETQEALRAHGGPWEYFNFDGTWLESHDPHYTPGTTYRVKPQPPAPVICEVVWHGTLECGFAETKDDDDTTRITLPTRDGHLVPGDYTGPDGLTIKVVAL